MWKYAIALAVALGGTYALADYKVNEGTNTTIFAFICESVKVCPAHVTIAGGADWPAGTEVGTALHPLRVSPSGTQTQAVTQSGAPWTVSVTNTPSVTFGAGASVTANAGTNLNTNGLATELGNIKVVGDAMLAQAIAAAGKKGPMVQCSVTSLKPGYTTATINPVSCDTDGNIRVNVATATGVTQGTSTGTQTGSIIMGTSRTTSLPTYGDLQSNVVTLNTNGGQYVTPSAGTLGGATPYHSYSVGGAPAGVNVKAGAAPGTVYTLSLQNSTNALYYFKFYDKATAPTCGSDAVVWATQIQTTGTASQGKDTTVTFPTGLVFANGIGFCITGAQADNDTTAAATGINISIAYK